MEVDTIRRMVISVNWTNQQEHISMLQVSAKLVVEFLNQGFRPVIVVDTFSGDKIARYLETLNTYDEMLSIRIFGLFTTEEELKRRIELRNDSAFRDFAISKKLNEDVVKWKQKTESQIDTTGLTEEQTAEIIFGRITNDGQASR